MAVLLHFAIPYKIKQKSPKTFAECERKSLVFFYKFSLWNWMINTVTRKEHDYDQNTNIFINV